jgi:hypothetical protein
MAARRGWPLAFGLLLLLELAIAVGLWQWRHQVLTDTASATAAQQRWDQFREQVASEVQREAPVRHRLPGSVEPPYRVLLRDHFATVLAAALFFSALLYGVLCFFVAGAWGRGQRASQENLDDCASPNGS